MAETNVRIKNEVHQEAAKYCSDNGLVLGKYCTGAIKERLERDKFMQEKITVSVLSEHKEKYRKYALRAKS